MFVHKLRGAIQRYAPSSIKQALWDREFAAGTWRHIDRPPTFTHPEVERYARGGDILDVGCGPGSTGNELTASTYRSYLGVDISEVCLATARRRAAECGRGDINRYQHGDALTFVPPHHMDVILFAESVYYIPPARVVPMLERYGRYLTATGHIIVRMSLWSPKHRALAETIRRQCAVRESFASTSGGVTMETLILRPRSVLDCHHPSLRLGRAAVDRPIE